MKIRIVAAGKLKEKYLREGVAEYEKRLAPFASVELLETREEYMAENPSEAQRQQALAKEGERLLRLVPEKSFLIVLDVKGKLLSSEALAKELAGLALQGRSDFTFLIGGALGLSPAVRECADLRISFSPMTFTHQMVRLLLYEQIYRAFKINRGEKYHW
ncbi:23S rRNA (pseudouridine(1915)-N(3))-methyltransferase RlmH [uncultured Selenomonas sp.]|uniref:23S rRNA (pseudouridine(1915)-N(3))-methyltransferase RlmH n=1 Tax=uncultured Selenomonas sp. TaxID=159275 RepID=UPI00260CF006|nr:23S rRNA (pseudouridine(1915)-N(3))-methyltransferase RlmH [uncultured Selenomonas sp.]